MQPCAQFLLCMFISILYMFRANMCPSSGENCISTKSGICHSFWMTVCYTGWYETGAVCVEMLMNPKPTGSLSQYSLYIHRFPEMTQWIFFIIVYITGIFIVYYLYVPKNAYIYIKIFYYITNASTCFGDTAPSSGSVNIAYIKIFRKFKTCIL
jgi:hypothetical protein